MENKSKKCSSKKHEEINAICYCQECKIYMCNKCENFHSELFQNHHQFKQEKDMNEIFTGFCKEKDHFDKLEFFCKNHNILCCTACISKIKRVGKGQHTDCTVCNIEDIKNEKKDKLKKNIIILENLSNNFQKSINELKIIFDKINKKKEELKLKIQKIFTNLRNKLNEREDELLLEVDKKFDTLFIKEDIIRNWDKFPTKIKLSLENGKKIDNDWNDVNKLNLIINECINIEKNIKDLNIINEAIKKSNYNNIDKIKFMPEQENNINKFFETIKKFGDLYYCDYCFKFKKCPININNDLLYETSGEKDNIITKTGKDGNVCITCENELEKYNVYKWKIKIIKTENYDIKIGIASKDLIEKSQNYENGWYLFCWDLKIYSGPPNNFWKEKTNLTKKDEIIVVMDMNKRTLKFMNDNEENEENTYSINDIPIDKPLFPAVIIYNNNDSIEICGY